MMRMSPVQIEDASLERASENERRHLWGDAARVHEEMLASRKAVSARDWEKVGFCYSRASTQAGSLREFRALRRRAVEIYDKAARLYGSERSRRSKGHASKCKAIARTLNSWLAANASEKKRSLTAAREHGRESLQAFRHAEDYSNSGTIFGLQMMNLLETMYVVSEWKEQRSIIDEGASLADDQLGPIQKQSNKTERVLAYSGASLFTGYVANVCREEGMKKSLSRKSLDYAKKALEGSKGLNDPYCVALSRWAAATSNLILKGDVKSAVRHAKDMRELGASVRDNYLQGVADYLLTFASNWTTLREGDPEKKKEGNKATIAFAKSAIRRLKLVAQDFFIAETYLFFVESYSSLAEDIGLSRDERRETLEQAVATGRKGLVYATRSGSGDALGSALHALSKALHAYSGTKTGRKKKRELLEEALTHRREFNNIVETVFSSSNWLRGIGRTYEGSLEAELARNEEEPDERIALLKQAISDMKAGILQCQAAIQALPIPTWIVIVGKFSDELGAALQALYLQEKQPATLTDMIQTYANAAENFASANLPSRAAESRWKIGRIHRELGEHQEAAHQFAQASAGYLTSAHTMPQLTEFYQDYASYMQAWSEIEKASNHHENGEYAASDRHYRRAAELLESTYRWKYLTPNYVAWAQLEQAEALSRSEQSDKAMSSFKKASETFSEAHRILQLRLEEADSPDEELLVNSLIKASADRRKYCRGRISLEEARILDMRGEPMISSKKYGEATQTFTELLEAAPETERKELIPIVILSQAWEKMMLAEARTSSRIYRKAAELFQQAKEHALNRQTSLLALANANFCKALENGTRFQATRKSSFHLTATHHLENAADYYQRAGFKTASEHAKATQRLFDAYVFMDKGKEESSPEKRAKYYLMAEKVLQASATSFAKAKHPDRSKQVETILGKAQEERELATSLSELLHAPPVTSSASTFVTPKSHELKAVGLEKFESANIQVSLTVDKQQIRVDEDFALRLGVSNVGKKPVLLTKLEQAFPPRFDLISKPDYCACEGTSITIKQRQLNPLDTLEMEFALRNSEGGVYETAPRLFHIDESGRRGITKVKALELSISEVVLPGRVPTGNRHLDNLLLGGIPENYSILLASSSCDERDALVRGFLELGAQEGQATFFLTIRPTGLEDLAQRFPEHFFTFLCNPKADVMFKRVKNIFKLSGVDNLTDISISMTSAFRKLRKSLMPPRRAVIDILSDVLLQHHVVQTRRWLNTILPELKSQGFTTLAVLNPQIHDPAEVEAILGTFEGEVSIYEKETTRGLERFMKVNRILNKRYLKSTLPITR
jgi:KaiC/GvpD/RAD55 family RecA-like ATPase